MKKKDNHVKFSSFYTKQAIDFESYFPESMFIVCPESYPKNLKKRHLRVCRFCGKNMPTVTFKHDSHVFPKALGNQFLISDFECDQCNQVFSSYEDDLMKFLGLSRTLSKVRGRKLNPEYISKDIAANKTLIFENEKVIKIENRSSEKKIQFDQNSLQQTISYTKQPYIPQNVFKAFYKMALSVIPENEISDYYLGLEFLKPNFPINIKSGLVIHEYRLPNAYEQMSAWLFRRAINKTETTFHSFVLLYDAYMFQMLLPFNRNDFTVSKTFSFPICPPFFDGTGDEKFKHLYGRIIDLSSKLPKKDDEENIVIKFNQTDLDKTVIYDPSLDSFVNKSEFDFNNIAGLYITRQDFSYKPKG